MSLRIVMIAPLRFPIRLPFAGGLESAVWNEFRLLRRRGHRILGMERDRRGIGDHLLRCPAGA